MSRPDQNEYWCPDCDSELTATDTLCPECGALVPRVHCIKPDGDSTVEAERCIHCWWPLVEPQGRWNDHIKAALASKPDALQRLRDHEIVATFPYCKWLTVGNGTPGYKEVRAEHAALHGKVFACSDAFWDNFLPPTDAWCRCGVVSLTASQIQGAPIYMLLDIRNGSPVIGLRK